MQNFSEVFKCVTIERRFDGGIDQGLKKERPASRPVVACCNNFLDLFIVFQMHFGSSRSAILCNSQISQEL